MTLTRHPGYKIAASVARRLRPATTRGTMIRPISTEVALFLIPFVVYALFLVATRRGLLDPAHWPLARLAWLVIAALVLMLGSFIWFATFGGAPPESTYIPAHVDENGTFVPGRSVPKPK
jgi:hypothetical protein